MSRSQNHYDVLQVKESASEEVIKGAYRYLSQKWHPDRNSGNEKDAEDVLKAINQAYAVLSDPKRRKEYDEWLSRNNEKERGSAHIPTPPPPPPPSTPQSPPGQSNRGGIPRGAIFCLAAVASVVIIALLIKESGLGVGYNISYAPAACTADRPLLVVVTNRLPLPLKSHSYRIAATKPGYSNDSKRDFSPRRSSKIVNGWATSSECISIDGQHRRRDPALRIVNDGSRLSQIRTGLQRATQERKAREIERENLELIWRAEPYEASWSGGFKYSSY